MGLERIPHFGLQWQGVCGRGGFCPAAAEQFAAAVLERKHTAVGEGVL